MAVPTTDNRRMSLMVSGLDLQSVKADVTRDTVLENTLIHYHDKNGRPKGIVHYLPLKLPIGAVVSVWARLVDEGLYQHDAGLLGGGHYHIGIHSIGGTMTSVSSSDESVLKVSFPDNFNTSRHVIVETLSAGTAQISLTMVETDVRGEAIGDQVTDTITLRVLSNADLDKCCLDGV